MLEGNRLIFAKVICWRFLRFILSPTQGEEMGLQFYLFHELLIVHKGNTLPALPYRLQNLLALLLLRPQLRRREQIVALLFPNASFSQGRKQLSDLLYQLRKALPDAQISADRDYISLDVARRWLDVDIFRACLKSGEVERWAEGVTLYRGDLLMSSYEDWLIEEREVLRMGFVNMAHRLCERLVEQHAYAKALPVAEQIVREEPYDERALRRLMHIYQALGRRGQALKVYEHYLAVTATELGLDPEQGTQVLAQSIRDACPVFFPRDLPKIEAQDAPDALLEYARNALNKSERSLVEALLKRLQRQQPSSGPESVRRLEIDLALRFDDLERAERLLDQCDRRQSQTLIRVAELALTRRQWPQAIATAEETLLLANRRGDPTCEARALWVVANAEQRIGQRPNAYRAGERALALARQHGPPEHAIDCLVTLGRMFVMEGRFHPAGEYASEAIALARQNGFPLHYTQAMRLSAWVQLRSGHLCTALAAYEEALISCRNVGIPKLEARILNDLAECNDLLGLSRRSLSLLKEAEALLGQCQDPIPVAINHYNQVFTHLYLGDDRADQAIDLALSALSVFRQHRQSHWVAVALVALGYAQWVGGRHRQALQSLAKSYRLHDQLGEREKFCEILALQAQANLGLGRGQVALACSREAILSMAQGSRAMDMQVEVFFAHALSLLATGDDAQAEDYLRRAYDVLIEIASALEDEPARMAFFSRDPITRRLMQEIYARGIARPAEAYRERRWLESRKRGYATHVQWTVDAGPADVALKQAKGAIAVRRVRLSRLIREAERQGVRPKEADLATALGVSVRTIQRDLAYLRKKREANNLSIS